MPKAIVVGSLNMDLVVTVDRHPRTGETVAGSELRYVPGGKGANQAIACRRLGPAVQMVGRVGDDTFGDELRSLQQAEGIDALNIRVVADRPTGLAIVCVAADASNTIVVTPGANLTWEPRALDAVTFQAGDVLLTQLEIPTSVVEAALKKAGAAGAIRVLNPSPISRFDDRLLAGTDVLVLNQLELWEVAGLGDRQPAGERDLDAAESRLSRSGVSAIITTLGANGCRIWSKDIVVRLDAVPAKALDTTGAGDCFAGALAAGLLEERSLEGAARLANAAASLSVTRAGAAPSMPSREQLFSALGVTR